ncbi:MAG TPA: hypothetical protein VK123_02785 [Candidatus Limnocylindrales bacterium]|nr:hypothetical protein [Candidatus Limnocylindrales bacterium]
MFDPLTHILDVPDKLLLVPRVLGARTRREAVNVNDFDEVPNSTWFTNRNHARAVPVAALALGPDSVVFPTKPWTIKHRKQGGRSVGFQIKDAGGRKWLVKVDPAGFPELGSGADMVARTLFHAAGYNVPHNEPITFNRDDLKIDSELLHAKPGERFTESDLDSMLVRGARLPDGSYSGYASLFLPGHPLGAPSLSRRRPHDTNDWYGHPNRRELRGLYVVCSWLGNWDSKDANFLDMFAVDGDSLGHVEHYYLDVGSSLGTQADGPKHEWKGYEYLLDYGAIAKRFVTLGFASDPWRRAHQDPGIPSVGNFEPAVFTPRGFRPEEPNIAFYRMTDRDAYWGAKIVDSFSDAQIAAAVQAGGYHDPRARDYLTHCLIERRDKIARYWFKRTAPLDFFSVEGGGLRFHDLAVDTGLEAKREYDVDESFDGGRPGHVRVRESQAFVSLGALGAGVKKVRLRLSVSGSSARPALVELTRGENGWLVTHVRHG